jgi:hypothetical protein
VVVRFAIGRSRHVPGYRRSLPRTAVLLAAVAALPSQSGSTSLLSSQSRDQASTAPRAGGAGRRSIATMPVPTPSFLSPVLREHALAPTTYGNFALPIGSPDPAWFAFEWNTVGLWETDPSLTASIHATISAETEEIDLGGPVSHGRGGPVSHSRTAARGGIHPICDENQLPKRLQAGMEFWDAQARSIAPVQLPSGIFAASSLLNANFLGDPISGPSGERSNLPSPGPAGAWCRPGPVPFFESSPLARRVLWMPVIVILAIFVLFWLSRGMKMPTRSGERAC